jgi:hypothetical protein
MGLAEVKISVTKLDFYFHENFLEQKSFAEKIKTRKSLVFTEIFLVNIGPDYFPVNSHNMTIKIK